MRIIGIDPGLRNTGWGVISIDGSRLRHVASGSCATSTKDHDGTRLQILFASLRDIVQQFQPQQAAIEDVFVSSNPHTSLNLGQARGIALLVPSMMHIPIYEYANRTIKKSVCGSGRADKVQIHHMVRMLLHGADPSDDHSADALATAICHAHMAQNQANIDAQIRTERAL